MLRRTKEEVLKELPPKRRIVQEIDHDETYFNKYLQNAFELLKKMDLTKNNLERRWIKERKNEKKKCRYEISKWYYKGKVCF